MHKRARSEQSSQRDSFVNKKSFFSLLGFVIIFPHSSKINSHQLWALSALLMLFSSHPTRDWKRLKWFPSRVDSVSWEILGTIARISSLCRSCFHINSIPSARSDSPRCFVIIDGASSCSGICINFNYANFLISFSVFILKMWGRLRVATKLILKKQTKRES